MNRREHDRDHYDDAWEFEQDNSGAGLMAAMLMAVALVILLASFVWFVVRLDPLTDDFIGGESPPTATPAPDDEE